MTDLNTNKSLVGSNEDGRQIAGKSPLPNSQQSIKERDYEESHPPLYGQAQLKNGFGPVYATPPVPWEKGFEGAQHIAPIQNGGTNQWRQDGGHNYQDYHSQQYFGHPQTMMPVCMRCHRIIHPYYS